MTRNKRNPDERFWEKVDKTDTCWIWTASKNHKGYGKFSLNGKPIMAHRYSWEKTNTQKVPKGSVVDHLCENKSCVRPDHLELTTNRENLLRGEVGKKNAAHHRAKTHCRNGHEYTDENTEYWNRKSRGVLTRRCKVCYLGQQERYSNK